MSLWTTYYFAIDELGERILEELDMELGFTDGSNRDGKYRGYFGVGKSPEDFDVMLEEIAPGCWEHVGKRPDA